LSYWRTFLKNWPDAPGVERLDVRLMNESVVSDFFGCLGCQPPAVQARHNVAYPSALARFIDAFDGYAESPFKELKFTWWRWVHRLHSAVTQRITAKGPLFPLSDSNIRFIVDSTRECNEQLLKMLGETSRQAVLENPSWWSPDPRTHRPEVTAETELAEEWEQLLGVTLQALSAADEAWRKVSTELRHCRMRQGMQPPGASRQGQPGTDGVDYKEICDSLVSQREKLLVDREQMLSAVDALTARMRVLVAERDTAVAERDALALQLSERSPVRAKLFKDRIGKLSRRLRSGIRTISGRVVKKAPE